MKKSLYPKDIYCSPSFVIQRLDDIAQSDPVFITTPELQGEREAWIAAVFLLGIGTTTKKSYWLRIVSDDVVPDINAFSKKLITRKGKQGYLRENLDIEVFEYESHQTVGLFDAIKNKLKNKSYPDHYILVCYIHNRAGEAIHLEEVFEQIQSMKPNVEIWIVSSVISTTVQNAYIVAKMYPNRFQVIFDYKAESERKRQKKFLKDMGRGYR